MNLGESPHYKAHPDDEGIDRIEMAVVPRYKQSGLSGDEWRTSVTIRFWRKGELVGERSFGRMEWAIMCLGAMWADCPELSPAPLWGLSETVCHQYGCANPATVVYRLKAEYSERGEGPLPEQTAWQIRRAFCERHQRRGDCGLEDADSNYEVVPTPSPAASTPAASPRVEPKGLER